MKQRPYDILALTAGLGSLFALKYFGVTGSKDSFFLIFGMSLFIAFASARLMSDFGLPKITTYLIAGLILGPHMTDIFSQRMVDSVLFIDKVALSLIALTAGGEINLRSGEVKILNITKFVLMQMFITFGLFFAVLYPLGGVLQPAVFGSIAAIVFMSIIANATSPSTTVAVIIETGAKGHLTNVVLTSAIMKDIIIIVIFTACLSIFSAAGEEASVMKVIMEESFSILAGVGAGFLITLYLRYIRQNEGVFILIFTLITTWIAGQVHLNPLLIFLAAGIAVKNLSIYGKSLVKTIEDNSQIVYLVFFFVAGAVINLEALSSMWLAAIIIVLLRAVTMHVGCYSTARATGETCEVRNYSSLGFIGQAGVSIGFAKIIGTTFPGWGEEFRTLILAVVAMNQIAGPVGFKWGLKKAGETR
ncbi:cation:proton antiporter [Limisalsivibrio acetivorans]|uniref:cation:proton antiporter n=1 Tax=Limisalsivibrio acetivorans TaxID=1304888 RepID=UPI0003B4E012|nr:cation:proton antiporter [Limisalsivibrio acetivorans]